MTESARTPKLPDMTDVGGPFGGTITPFNQPSELPASVTTRALPTFNLTDVGNAERFAQQQGDLARYCAGVGWLAWDGHRWAPDRDGKVRRLAIETVRAIYSEAAALNDSAERKALAEHGKRSESERRVAAMLKLAEAMRPVAALPETFDGPQTTFLLNVLNGTLDLQTGELREHRHEDCITKLAPVAFDPDARSDEWDAFLEKQVPDPEVRAFLQRAAGYNLTGSTGEEKLLFIYGPTAAGKGTFTEALKAALGEYAMTSPFEAFLRKRGDAGVRDDIARLTGARMVLASEVDEGRAFDAGALKALTGGDTVAARHLYGRYFEYKPAFKLWLVANHRPHANARDAALWRRVLVVPFTRTVPEKERDPSVKVTLTQTAEARSAILAWAFQGCLEWLRDGLQPPAAVRLATASYRESCDAVGRFLADNLDCFDFTTRKVTAKDLQAKYRTWCDENDEKRLPANDLAEALRDHGLTPTRSGSTRYWRLPEGQLGPHDNRNGELSSSTASRRDFTETGASGVPRVPRSETPEPRSWD